MQRRIRRRRPIVRKTQSQIRERHLYRKRNAAKLKKGAAIYYRKNRREILRRAKERRARG